MFSLNKLMELNITRTEAKQVRQVLALQLIEGERTDWEENSPEYEIWHDTPSRKLHIIDRLLDGFHGVEILRSADDTYNDFCGISYLNTGDTYTTTLLFDHGHRLWMVTDWGSIVERQSRRFADAT